MKNNINAVYRLGLLDEARCKKVVKKTIPIPSLSKDSPAILVSMAGGSLTFLSRAITAIGSVGDTQAENSKHAISDRGVAVYIEAVYKQKAVRKVASEVDISARESISGNLSKKVFI